MQVSQMADFCFL